MKDVIDFLKIISDETRLKILLMVLKREMCVCEIIEELGLSQSLISHHLRLLRKNDLVRDERDGKWIFYSANVARLNEVLLQTNNLFARSTDNEGLQPGNGRNYDFCRFFDTKKVKFKGPSIPQPHRDS